MRNSTPKQMSNRIYNKNLNHNYDMEDPKQDYYEDSEPDYYEDPEEDYYEDPEEDYYEDPEEDYYEDPEEDYYEDPEEDYYEDSEEDYYEDPEEDYYEDSEQDELEILDLEDYEEDDRVAQFRQNLQRNTTAPRSPRTFRKDLSRTLRTPHNNISRSLRAPRKKHPFLLFMLIWSSLLVLVISVGLSRFYHFLENYEAAYEASRPDLDMTEYISLIQSGNCDAIYALLTVKPTLSAFETEDTFKSYISELIRDKKITYVPSGQYTEEAPKYLIQADGVPIAELNLSRSQTQSMQYDFPVWELSDFELYTDAAETFLVQAPSDYTVRINDVPLDETYLYESGITPAEQQYVKDYATIPACDQYYGEGLYLPPSVTAQDKNGQELTVTYDAQNQMYVVPFTSYAPEREAMEAYAIQAVEDYCEYISQDLPDDGLDQYFPAGSRLLYLIKHNSSRRFFAHHRSSDFQNVEVKNFILYSDDLYYCEVYTEQVLIMSYGSTEPEILPYTGRFYFVKIDGQWKIAGIVY